MDSLPGREWEELGFGCVACLMSMGRPGRDAENRRKGGGGDADSQCLARARGWSSWKGPGRSLGRDWGRPLLGVWPEGAGLRARGRQAGVCCLDGCAPAPRCVPTFCTHARPGVPQAHP